MHKIINQFMTPRGPITVLFFIRLIQKPNSDQLIRHLSFWLKWGGRCFEISVRGGGRLPGEIIEASMMDEPQRHK